MRDLKIFVLMLVGIAAISVISVVGLGCGTLKSAGRTLNDAASIMCNVFAVELAEIDPERLGGMTATDYCAVHDNLKPFIDQALLVKNAAVAASLAGPVAPAPAPGIDPADAGAP